MIDMNDLTPLVNEILEEVKRETNDKLNMDFWLTRIIDALIIMIQNGLDIEHLTKKQRKNLSKAIIQMIAYEWVIQHGKEKL